MEYKVQQKNEVVFNDGANIIIRSLSDILKASEYLEGLEKGE